MKTRELIEHLQREDPSGELEVVAGNTPIWFVEQQPAFYDGDLQILICTSGDGKEGYKVTDRGIKVRLHLRDLESVLMDDPDAHVDLTVLREQARAEWAVYVDKIRKECK
jgi:hypothetical protein